MDLLKDLVQDRFGITVARELCKKSELFERGKLYKHIDIVEMLRDEFVKLGGNDDTSNDAVARVLKRWLLHAASPFRKEARGRYRYLGFDRMIEQSVDVGDRSHVRGDAPKGWAPTPEFEVGAGLHEVFAWSLPQYEAMFGDRWPIRIGRAGPEGFSGRLSEILECLPEWPRYLLRLGCLNETQAMERVALVHAWFRSRGQELEELPGDGWFLANPSEIEDAIQNIIGTDALSGNGNTLQIEDIIADAFKDVTDDDWAALPKDLTERLDEYLYGSDLK